MVFNSISFIAFFVIISLIRWKLPEKYSGYVLLLANVVFCASYGALCALFALAITIAGYFSAKMIEGANDDKNKQKAIAVAAVTIICGVLLLFKYGNAFSDRRYMLIIPIGMSFYSFRNISYVVDVYKGMEAEKNIVNYCNYSVFFPTFSAGPIERYSNMGKQLREKPRFDHNLANRSVVLIMTGLLKKCVISEHMAFYTEWIYGNIRQYTGFTLVLISFFYTIQIYCDFSGYSDMAIGIAGLMGYRIKDNFRHPYLADGLGDFWRRWHISLSTWLKDYVYIPLGGSHCSKFRSCVNLIITFLVSGVWHGAGVNYLIWGGCHGVFSAFERLYKNKYNNVVCKIIRCIMTFVVVNFLWVVFRLNDFGEVVYYFSHIFEGITDVFQYIMSAQRVLHMDYITLIRIIFFILALMIYDLVDEKKDLIGHIALLNGRKKVLVYMVLILLTFTCLPVQQATEYIYFSF